MSAKYFAKESDPEETSTETAPKSPKFSWGNGFKARKAAIIAGCIALAALSGGYAYGRSYCSTHFPPGSVVCGVDASWMTASELGTELERSAKNYVCHVVGDGIDLSLDSASMGMEVEGIAVAQKALDLSDKNMWPAGLVTTNEIDSPLSVKVDRQMVSDALYDTLTTYNQTATQPTNAQVVYDSENQTFVTEPEVLGTLLDYDAVVNAVYQSAQDLEPEVELGVDQLARPAVLSDSARLISACDKANKMAQLSVPLTFEGKTVATVDSKQIVPAMRFDDTDGNVTPYVDFDSLWNWAYDTLNTLVNGETETRVWEVNSWETANALKPKLEAMDSTPLEVATITIEERPEESEGHEQYGRHIDVNITTQYARLYDTDGKTVLWRSPIVSGNPNMGYGTAQGWFTMDWRDEDITLYGPPDEETGEPQWASPVRWWMGFYMNSDGFHDADWRWEDEFGGDTYLYAGSHGCVNLPIDKAEELWNLTDFGEKVYVHE